MKEIKHLSKTNIMLELQKATAEGDMFKADIYARALIDKVLNTKIPQLTVLKGGKDNVSKS